MTKKNNGCLLSNYRRDKCAGCDGVCSYRIAIQGLNGDGGRLASAGIPERNRGVTLATSPVREGQPRIYDTLAEYVKTFTREPSGIRSLYLWSEEPGTGKTTTASALLTEFIIRQYLTGLRDGSAGKTDAYFLDVNEWQTDYNTFNRPRVPDHMAEPAAERYYRAMEKAQYAQYAVLDDMGVRDATDSFRADLHTVINHRNANGIPTVYTSNLAMTEMGRVFDARLYDRLRDNTGAIMFGGKSHRGRR